MKPFINTLAIALVFLTSLSTFASRQFDVQVKSNQILNININNIGDADQLMLKDSNNEVLFSDKSLAQPYIKNISLKTLPEGTYFLSLEDNNMISTKTVFKNASGIEISNSAVAFKPNFKEVEQNSRKLKVAFTNPTMEMMKFKIYDENGNLVIDLKNKDAVFNKTIDFSDAPSGEYSIAVNNNGRSYYRSITIK